MRVIRGFLILIIPLGGSAEPAARIELPKPALSSRSVAASKTGENLARLAPILDTTLNMLTLPGNRVEPQAWNTSMAFLISAEKQGLYRSPPRTSAAKPLPVIAGLSSWKDVVRRVNETFKGVDLAGGAQRNELTVEQLDALAGLAFDRIHGNVSLTVEAVAALSQAKLHELMRWKGRPAEHVGGERMKGLPEGVKLIRPSGGEVRKAARPDAVFRHYTTRENFTRIMETGTLPNNYAGVTEGKIWSDLTGVFLGSPGVPGLRAGSDDPSHAAYVDVRLASSLALLEIREGVFLVPLPARTRGWIRDLYRRWNQGEPISGYTEGLVHLDEEGGPGPDLDIPVDIVRGEVLDEGRRVYLDLARQSPAGRQGLRAVPDRDSGGTHDGGWFTDARGRSFYGKTYSDPERVHLEKLANDLYRLFGIGAPETRANEMGERLWLVSREIKGRAARSLVQFQRSDFRDGFVIDAWLGNWNFAGHDNVLIRKGRAYRIDNGEALFWKARDRYEALSPRVKEIFEYREGGNPLAVFFGDLSDVRVARQARRFISKYSRKKRRIDDLIRSSGLSTRRKNQIRRLLHARAQWLGGTGLRRLAARIQEEKNPG